MKGNRRVKGARWLFRSGCSKLVGGLREGLKILKLPPDANCTVHEECLDHYGCVPVASSGGSQELCCRQWCLEDSDCSDEMKTYKSFSPEVTIGGNPVRYCTS